MSIELDVSDDPEEALSSIQESSASASVLVFKKSPICPVSTMAEGELTRWLSTRSEDDQLRVVLIDVIARRSLARGLVAALGIRHESPQALLFRGGEVVWHESHGELTESAFAEAVG